MKTDLSDNIDTALQLYTPAMMAQTIGVSVRAIRIWHRKGLIQPVRMVQRIPYFDYPVLSQANTFAHWMRQGMSAQSIAQQIASLGRLHGSSPHEMLESLQISLDGKRLILQQDSCRMESNGQLQFGFETEVPWGDDQPITLKLVQPAVAVLAAPDLSQATEVEAELSALLDAAMQSEDHEDLDEAARLYREILARFGPSADVCFQLAEILYRQADLGGARERYYVAIELDPGLVEARANLGCVLAEQGHMDLAVSEFQIALEQHPEYADVHFHLARALDIQGQTTAAIQHWQKFIELAPASPWADEAIVRLTEQPSLEFEP
jgi:DNA-binding transcriptional MerR regulator